MNLVIQYVGVFILSLVFSITLLQLLRKIAVRFKLVDKPNERKVHHNSIPILGGIAIIIATGLALLIAPQFWVDIQVYYVVVIGVIVLMIIGAIDDKMNVSPILKLAVQLVLAHFVFNSGIRIESMFGIFGIYELSTTIQYLLTLVVIVGVINAFNLMDGIDGLAAGLAIIGFLVYICLAVLVNQLFLVVLFIAIIGALIGFLKFNLSVKNKIFMGDAGSLVLGFVLVVAGIFLIQSVQGNSFNIVVLVGVIGVLQFPVLDSLRVFYGRIKLGLSPFKADKTHFHHLVLLLGLGHKRASFFIILFITCVILLNMTLLTMFKVTFTVLFFLFLFVLIASVLELNRKLNIWKQKIKILETPQ